MKESREIVTLGLQQGDMCHIVTESGQHLYVQAVRTSNGHVKLEVDMPPRYRASKIAKRKQENTVEA